MANKYFKVVCGIRICTKPELNLVAIQASGEVSRLFAKDEALERFESLPVSESCNILKQVCATTTLWLIELLDDGSFKK